MTARRFPPPPTKYGAGISQPAIGPAGPVVHPPPPTRYGTVAGQGTAVLRKVATPQWPAVGGLPVQTIQRAKLKIDYAALVDSKYRQDKGCAFMSINWATGIDRVEIFKGICEQADGDVEQFDEDRHIAAYLQSIGIAAVTTPYARLTELITDQRDGKFLVSVGVGSSCHMVGCVLARGKVVDSFDTTALRGRSKGDLVKDWGWQAVSAAWKVG